MSARISIGSFDLPDGEDLYFKVVAKINGSTRGYVSECVKGNLLRMRGNYRDRIEVLSRQYNLSWEQTFNLYLNFDPPFTQEQITSVKNMPITIHKDYGSSVKLGNEANKGESL